MLKLRLRFLPIQIIGLGLVFLLMPPIYGQEPMMNFQQNANALLARNANNLVNMDQFSIDPSVYLLGPGDEIEIRCSKMPWVRFSGTINDAGILYIPEFGTMNVGKRTLNLARQDIAFIVRKNCVGGDIDVRLTQPKMAEVTIIGQALNSGSYRLTGDLRVLDAVKKALKDSTLLNTAINLREVSVNIQGAVSTYDIARFMATGTSADNPYLYPGEIITIIPITKRVTISGAVFGPLPSTISFKTNETIGDILRLYKFAPDADSASIQLLRQNYDPATFDYSKLNASLVQNYDNIVVGVKAARVPLFQVIVKGEVKNPGVYPITPGITTATQILNYAGGVTQFGDCGRAYVRHKDPLSSGQNSIAAGLVSVRPERNFGARHMISSGDYRIVPLAHGADALLENEDEISVPQKCQSVYVSGYVSKPGSYPFSEGKGISYYVGLAGGFASSADKANTKLLAIYGESWSVKEPPINTGDLIVVPEKVQERPLPWWDFAVRTLYYVSLAALAVVQLNDKLHFFHVNQ